MTGRRSTSARTISNDAPPEPITIEARNSTVGTPERAQQPADLLPAREVARERRVAAESAEIHDPTHAGRGGRAAELDRGAAVGVLEGLARAHRVDEVVRGVDAVERGTKGRSLEQVAVDHLRVRADLRAQMGRIAREAAHPLAGPLERTKQSTADIAGGASDEEQAIVCPVSVQLRA